MSWRDIRFRIRDILLEADGVHNVHTRERVIRDKARFDEAFIVPGVGGAPDILTGWMITRNRRDEDYVDSGTLAVNATHNVIISGFYGVDDEAATEETFQDIIDALAGKFRERFRLENAAGDVLPTVLMSRLVDVTEIGHSQLQTHLVHSCRVNLQVQERLT